MCVAYTEVVLEKNGRLSMYSTFRSDLVSKHSREFADVTRATLKTNIHEIADD